ncbi:hypothetical protein ABT298_32980, partial [Streptomyces sp. NPDC001034]|uniref:hypothetical protein n=1 Tax=Streptomyces sp. NPDC001034 TaxID=3154375 RepID=UPI00332CF624
VIPDDLHAVVDRATWTPGAIFDLVAEIPARGAAVQAEQAGRDVRRGCRGERREVATRTGVRRAPQE